MDLPIVTECRYLPDGWIATRDRKNTYLTNLNNGNVVTVPNFEFEFSLKREFEATTDRIIWVWLMSRQPC